MKCELAMQALDSFGKLRIRAFGVSMLPTILPGDVLRVVKAKLTEIVPGDVVVCVREDSPLIHRAIQVDFASSQLVTRGDSMGQPDPHSVLLGKVVELERNGRAQVVSRRIGLLGRIVGIVLCHSAKMRSLYLRLVAFKVGSEYPAECPSAADGAYF